jgi:hypothetical protein
MHTSDLHRQKSNFTSTSENSTLGIQVLLHFMSKTDVFWVTKGRVGIFSAAFIYILNSIELRHLIFFSDVP